MGNRFLHNKTAVATVGMVAVIALMGIFAPWIAPNDPYATDILNKFADYSWKYPLGTDQLGRDYAIRVMMGSRVSLTVGLVASAIILLIGSIYGSIAGFFGGWVDMVMMRIVDIIYTVPDVLIVILLATVLNYPLKELAMKPGFEWIGLIGVNLISIFVVFALLAGVLGLG